MMFREEAVKGRLRNFVVQLPEDGQGPVMPAIRVCREQCPCFCVGFRVLELGVFLWWSILWPRRARWRERRRAASSCFCHKIDSRKGETDWSRIVRHLLLLVGT